jgi:hypothetical protein
MPNGDWEKRDEGMRKRRKKGRITKELRILLFIVFISMS